jgi:hypothetical protein
MGQWKRLELALTYLRADRMKNADLGGWSQLKQSDLLLQEDDA